MKTWKMVALLLAISQAEVSLPAVAAGSRKPWEIPAKERAQMRLDRASRVSRVHEYESQHGSMGRRTEAAPETANVIDGAKNPELFFPTELFRRLVDKAFVSLPQVYPRVVASRTSDLFRDPNDWDYFRSTTTELANLIAEQRKLEKAAVRTAPTERNAISSQLARLRAEQCAAMRAELSELRTHFGHDRFDRMLYEVVAPSLLIVETPTSASDTEADVERTAQKALADEEACQ